MPGTPGTKGTPLPKSPITIARAFMLVRPLPTQATNLRATTGYLYGTSDLFSLPVQHGADFANLPGTPVQAAGNGTVLVAGEDRVPLCGEPERPLPCGPDLQYYGNLVVIRLDRTYREQGVFLLYGHMESIQVQVGQRVQAGQSIGTTGETGQSFGGPHLHLEVRLGTNSFASTRNPGLWIQPLAAAGVLAGIAVDLNGQPLRGWSVEIARAESPDQVYLSTETYQRDDRPPVNSDDELGENFLAGDLPAGKYVVTVRQGARAFSQAVVVEEGKLTFVALGYL